MASIGTLYHWLNTSLSLALPSDNTDKFKCALWCFSKYFNIIMSHSFILVFLRKSLKLIYKNGKWIWSHWHSNQIFLDIGQTLVRRKRSGSILIICCQFMKKNYVLTINFQWWCLWSKFSPYFYFFALMVYRNNDISSGTIKCICCEKMLHFNHIVAQKKFWHW